MAHIILNGTTFNGTPTSGSASAWQPTGYNQQRGKIGTTLVAANGTRNRVERSVVKRVWTLQWDRANAATRGTLRTIAALTTSFSFTDVDSTVYTVQVEEPLEETFGFIDGTSTQYWDMTLVLHQV
jgi:hypothetical protein